MKQRNNHVLSICEGQFGSSCQHAAGGQQGCFQSISASFNLRAALTQEQKKRLVYPETNWPPDCHPNGNGQGWSRSIAICAHSWSNNIQRENPFTFTYLCFILFHHEEGGIWWRWDLNEQQASLLLLVLKCGEQKLTETESVRKKRVLMTKGSCGLCSSDAAELHGWPWGVDSYLVL